MSIAAAVRSMKSRMPWTVGQKVLEDLGIPRGRGWVETEQKLNAGDHTESEAALRDAIEAHLMCGEKLTRLYAITASDKAQLLRSIKSAPIEESTANKIFPYLLSDEQLSETSAELKLYKVVEFEDGTAAFFGSIRTAITRVELDKSEIPEEASEALGEYDELIGIKHKKIQSVDVVWIPNNGNFIEVRVDYPNGINRKVAEFAHQRLAGKMQETLGSQNFGSLINLFPLIESMYLSQSEGKVVEISFGTTTSSIKNELMRRKRLCLRAETYHVGGKAALGSPIEPHRVSIVWARQFAQNRFSHPELSLNSTTFERGKAVPLLFDAEISNCMGQEDYDFVVSRMAAHLP